MNRDVSIYLGDLSGNMRDAGDLVRATTFERFQSDQRTVNAALRSIEVKILPQAERVKIQDTTPSRASEK